MKARKIQMQQLFGFIVILYVATNMLAQTKFSGMLPMGALVTVSRILVYAFLLLRLVVSSTIRKSQLLLLPLIIGLAVIVTFTSERTIIIDTLVILLAARKYDPYKIMWDACRVQFVILAITIIASMVGIIDNTAIIQIGYSFAREGLGFNYTTYGANYFFHLVLVYFLIKGDKLKIWHVVVIEIVNAFIYIKTNTNAVFVMCGIVTILTYLAKFIKKPIDENGILKTVFYSVFPISVFTAFFTAINYNPSNARWFVLNSLLAGRLKLAHIALTEYTISPLGQLVQWNTSLQKSFSDTVGYFYVDSSYINIALVYGWIILALVCIAYIALMKKGVKDNNVFLCITISFLALHSIFDPQLIELRYNLMLLCLAPVLNLDGLRTLGKKREDNIYSVGVGRTKV